MNVLILAKDAHIGGLVGGYLLTMALGIPGKYRKSDKINGTIVTILLLKKAETEARCSVSG